MSIPIIFIHLNNRKYLFYTLLQAKKSNPNSEIFLIGDASNNCYKFVQHEDIFTYSAEAIKFIKIYKHYHTINSYAYELLCLQRWFILKNFMASRNIDKCVYLDSDVMLYADIMEEQKKFSDFDFTLSKGVSPHCVFINNLNALQRFCSFVTNMYLNPSDLKYLEFIFNNEFVSKNLEGGISDMTLFSIFHKSQECYIGDVSIIIDNSTYDHNINVSLGFEMRESKKNIYFIEDQPFCKNVHSGKEIKFNTLHLQGDAKNSIKNYFLGEITLDESYIILPLKLRDINLIVFPDWLAPEESLSLEFQQVIRALMAHPARSQMTLLIDASNVDQEEANLVLSGVIMNLLMEEDWDVTESAEISLVGKLNNLEVIESGESSICKKLSEIQWNVLLARLQARIVLKNESNHALSSVRAESIPYFDLNSLSDKRAVHSETGVWELI